MCSLSTPSPGDATNASYSSNIVTISQFIDPTTAYVLPASLSLQFASALCNSNATLSLSSKNSGMKQYWGSTVAEGSGTFLNSVPYTATAKWASVELTLKSADNSASKPVGGAISGPLTLTLNTEASSVPVLQGAYHDIITLKLAATP